MHARSYPPLLDGSPSPRRRPTGCRRLPSPPHCSDLNGTARVADTSGQVCVTLQHPPSSCGHPDIGGFVIGGLVLQSPVYHL
jgi:hypothetical protein